MNTKLLIVFIVLNIANVVIQTVKSIATVKCGKLSAAIINAVAYGLYTIVTVYLMCELDLYLKAGIVALCNLVGVYVVKWAEEKARKDKLWKIEATVTPGKASWLMDRLNQDGISWNYIDVNKWVIFNIYCATQAESRTAKEYLAKAEAKYFVSESKTL